MLGKRNAAAIFSVAADARAGRSSEHGWLASVAPKAFYALLDARYSLIGGRPRVRARERPPRVFDPNPVP
ncbi:MAG TPA: hypothetical protein VGJ91_11635 [Polyangiaceae bacterium]